MSNQKFQQEITVPPSAIDHMGHVNNVQYLQWVQDIAAAHWQTESTEAWREKYAWVALEHHINYHNPAFEGEQLLLETWIERFEGVKSIRKTKISRPQDSKTMATATTHWCLLSMPSGKPLRIPQEIIKEYEND